MEEDYEIPEYPELSDEEQFNQGISSGISSMFQDIKQNLVVADIWKNIEKKTEEVF